MNKEKLLYEAPTAQSFEVRFEGMICGSPNYGSQGSAGADQGFTDYGTDF